ncbi:MAG: SIS domain-containing protein [Mesorhizobium sp.]|uniref:SIS domain-containing protein n=1 Tax=Mesorhizobium sp. TaxID=1871066 RepID=UPI000FE5A94E|nr:SIS domain-containing protein [Mesorhizobium sp.]RWD37124.1 MAG: SIS domain-containing protein [Mesorhizobium sp.]RWD85809.1 MAG: SIS domain-containing protein [Mesorhizobium sp.]RWE54918.1 MAG: SIS domain-containing protein [Mesorhizobium sp.]TIS40104.1 MAG: SIS domain-containing protein [Mesorhizobium sp.]TIX69691.1 MAG: SIS domain-containing protein [Mesorhizobium sp.]
MKHFGGNTQSTDIGARPIKHFGGSAQAYFKKLETVLASLDYQSFDNAVALVAQAQEDGKQIITLGNGGSSLTALHFITDWNKSVYLSTKRPFRGRTLVDNVGLTFAYANDVSFEDVFVEQLKNLLNEGDLVIAISGSGNSENVLRAVRYANDHGAVTLGLCGYGGGTLRQIAQHVVWVNVNDMQLSEDIHSSFGHVVMQRLCFGSTQKWSDRRQRRSAAGGLNPNRAGAETGWRS